MQALTLACEIGSGPQVARLIAEYARPVIVDFFTDHQLFSRTSVVSWFDSFSGLISAHERADFVICIAAFTAQKQISLFLDCVLSLLQRDNTLSSVSDTKFIALMVNLPWYEILRRLRDRDFRYVFIHEDCRIVEWKGSHCLTCGFSRIGQKVTDRRQQIRPDRCFLTYFTLAHQRRLRRTLENVQHQELNLNLRRSGGNVSITPY